MALTLTPHQATRLFLDLEHQQQTLLNAKTARPGQRAFPLPACPACGIQPDEITVAASKRFVRFEECGHLFTLSREALVRALRAVAR